MKLLHLLATAAALLFSTGVAVPTPGDDPSEVVQAAQIFRRADTPEYAAAHAAHPDLVAGTKYVFELTWANGGGYTSPELKAYCERLGFKHKAVLVGYVSGGGRRDTDFVGTTYDLLKNEEDKGVYSGSLQWKHGRETLSYIGELKSGMTDSKIKAAGKSLSIYSTMKQRY